MIQIIRTCITNLQFQDEARYHILIVFFARLRCSLRVKGYRRIEPTALRDVGCCSKTGHDFASQRNVVTCQSRHSKRRKKERPPTRRFLRKPIRCCGELYNDEHATNHYIELIRISIANFILSAVSWSQARKTNCATLNVPPSGAGALLILVMHSVLAWHLIFKRVLPAGVIVSISAKSKVTDSTHSLLAAR